jgi:hypothetical protein
MEPLDFKPPAMFTAPMNLLDLTAEQLKRAASIKEQITGLQKELATILGMPSTDGMPTNNRRTTMSAAAKRRIAAAQKARWARLRSAKTASTSKPGAKKKSMSAATKAKVAAKLKAYWAAKKAGKK